MKTVKKSSKLLFVLFSISRTKCSGRNMAHDDLWFYVNAKQSCHVRITVSLVNYRDELSTCVPLSPFFSVFHPWIESSLSLLSEYVSARRARSTGIYSQFTGGSMRLIQQGDTLPPLPLLSRPSPPGAPRLPCLPRPAQLYTGPRAATMHQGYLI